MSPRFPVSPSPMSCPVHVCRSATSDIVDSYSAPSENIKMLDRFRGLRVPTLRPRATPHAKVMYCYDHEPGGPPTVRWMYVGSHNFSRNAWGNSFGEGRTTIGSYELGVRHLLSFLRLASPPSPRLPVSPYLLLRAPTLHRVGFTCIAC